MEVITITSDAFKEIINGISEMSNKIDRTYKHNPLSETWLDIQDVCMLLKISKRTLQAYRDNKVLPFSQVAGKIYFKAADIDKHLQKHYNKSYKD